MLKKSLSMVMLLVASAVTLHGQHGGGSEKEVSPWWASVGAGMNVWCGNEEEASVDGPGFLFGVEVGRWMAPQWGLSLRLSALSVHAQTRSAMHPMIDFTGLAMTAGQYPYQPFAVFGLSAMATATVDWSNLGGEEIGGWHLYSPFSVGGFFLMGRQENPADAEHLPEEMRASGSCALSAAIGLRYGFSKIEVYGEAGMMFTGGGVDWSPEESGGIDMMPMLSLGLRFALPSRETNRYIYDYHLQNDNDLAWADREPHGLVDDMLYTNEQLHLPTAVIKFAAESNSLDDKALRQLNLFVSQIDALDWFESFYIIGSADDSRMAESDNIKLCESRCQAVYKALVGEFGVDDSRLILLPGGGFSEYAHQYGERMVLLIQRTPETEEVVERWISSY